MGIGGKTSDSTGIGEKTSEFAEGGSTTGDAMATQMRQNDEVPIPRENSPRNESPHSGEDHSEGNLDMMGFSGKGFQPSTLNPQPSTLNPQPSNVDSSVDVMLIHRSLSWFLILFTMVFLYVLKVSLVRFLVQKLFQKNHPGFRNTLEIAFSRLEAKLGKKVQSLSRSRKTRVGSQIEKSEAELHSNNVKDSGLGELSANREISTEVSKAKCLDNDHCVALNHGTKTGDVANAQSPDSPQKLHGTADSPQKPNSLQKPLVIKSSEKEVFLSKMHTAKVLDYESRGIAVTVHLCLVVFALFHWLFTTYDVLVVETTLNPQPSTLNPQPSETADISAKLDSPTEEFTAAAHDVVQLPFRNGMILYERVSSPGHFVMTGGVSGEIFDKNDASVLPAHDPAHDVPNEASTTSMRTSERPLEFRAYLEKQTKWRTWFWDFPEDYFSSPSNINASACFSESFFSLFIGLSSVTSKLPDYVPPMARGTLPEKEVPLNPQPSTLNPQPSTLKPQNPGSCTGYVPGDADERGAPGFVPGEICSQEISTPDSLGNPGISNSTEGSNTGIVTNKGLVIANDKGKTNDHEKTSQTSDKLSQTPGKTSTTTNKPRTSATDKPMKIGDGEAEASSIADKEILISEG